jgi:tRNA(Ile2) C34 agmatinyltransferase TiaS
MIFIGLDDTDTLESRGTGHLARRIAAALTDAGYVVSGVTRHQLLKDPRVPSTSKNSCAAILLDAGEEEAGIALDQLLAWVRALMLANFQPGSDPGLCVARDVPAAITAFGRRAQTQLVDQGEARRLAETHALLLEGLGGTNDGVIGALAAVGLAASGEDGRYVLVGRSRELRGLQPVSALLAAGIAAVQTLDSLPVVEGLVRADKLRPARRGGRAVVIVERDGDCWQPLKLD